MQPTRNAPNKKAKFIDTKIFIASLGVAVTVGLWNLLSNNAVQANKPSQTVVATQPAQTNAVDAQGFPPLPTLVPLIDISSPRLSGSSQANQTQAIPQVNSLRSVTAPDQVIVQKVKPVIDQPVVTINGGGGHGGGGGGSSSGSVTTTSSSRK